MKKTAMTEFFRIYGSFAGIFIIFVLILFFTVTFSKSAIENELRHSVEKVLEEYLPGKWIVGTGQKVNSPLSLSSALYEIRGTKNSKKAHAVILRTSTFFGPMNAVFIYADGQTEFAGYSSLHGRIKKHMEQGSKNPKLNYWKTKIPKIVDNAGGQVR